MKNLFPILLLGAGLFTFSCSSDDLTETATSSNEATVTFTVAQPGTVQTRATYADGLTATTLWYAVYDDEGNLLEGMMEELDNQFEANSLETTLTLTLAKGNTYTVFFWAESPNSPYSVNFEGTEASISYSEGADLVCNTDDYDAFYNSVEITVTGNTSQSVELYRPFAQINVGACDVDEYEASANTTLDQTKVVVTGVGTSMSLWDGSIEDASETVTFDFADIPGENQTFPYEDEDGEEVYTYLSMNYLLVGEEESTVDIVFYYDETETDEESATHKIPVSSVPVQRNYQTNIFGHLLTGSVDFNIVKMPDFEEPDYLYDYDIVTTEDELVTALADGRGALLANDISLTEILDVTEDATIDLDGYTLSNDEDTAILCSTDGISLTIENGTITSGYHGVALSSNDATVTISNVTITSSAEPVVIGSDSMDESGNTVYVTDSELSTDGAYTGIIIQGAPQYLTVENCTISAGYFGIYQNGTTAGSTISVSGSTISALYSGIYLSNATQYDYNNLTVDDCTITSQEESAIEVKKTNLTVTNSNLIAENTSAQSYSYYSGGSNGIGFGIMLAETAGGQGSAYEGEVSLSGITYTISASANPDGGSTPWNVGYYSDNGLIEYEADGAAE